MAPVLRTTQFEDFLRAYPAYAETASVDVLRATEYRRLDAQQCTYLDYTGGSLYAQSQLDAHRRLLQDQVLGNPHSGNPASLSMTELVERARLHVLEFFGAAADEYVAIFTANATGALKLVGEAYPFTAQARFLATSDNHNSVNGVREFARRRGATIAYAPISAPELRIDAGRLEHELEQPAQGHKLFAYPAQSNFSGIQHDLRWIERAHDRGWDVLLDAAAFAPTNRLDLRHTQADFVSISFYKLFGYPTGSGALIARRAALAKLERPWFAGGTITVSSVSAANQAGDGFYLSPGAAGFEDGTVNYLSLPAVDFGLRFIESIGLETIHTRVMCLTDWLLSQLGQLRHANGQPVLRTYGPRTTDQRGATLALNILDPDGSVWNCWHVEALANQRNLSLRAGCHCNPGAREAALDISSDESASYFADKDRQSYADYVDAIRDKLSGVVRVSLGVASNFADVQRFVEFASTFADEKAPT